MFFIQTLTSSAAITARISALVFVEIFTWGVLEFHLATHPLRTLSVVPLIPVALSLGHIWMGLGMIKLLVIFAGIFFVARTVVLGVLLGMPFYFGLGTTRRGRRTGRGRRVAAR